MMDSNNFSSHSSMKIQNLVLLGPPGSGKSTQAHLLVERLHLTHIDTGAALRRVSSQDTAFGRSLYEIINVRKELVSDGTVGAVLMHEMESVAPESGVVIDGAPRRASQIDEVERAFHQHARVLDTVIFIYLPEDISIERIASRFACTRCNKPYIIALNDRDHHSLVCDDCGGALEQRKDDTPDGVRKRLEVFAEETLPVIERYRKAGKLLQVDGTKSAEEIFEDIKKGLSLE